MVSKSVLVVEDEEDIRKLLSYTLLKEGYEVAGVASGEAALASAESQPPDLVLLDLMLPGVDGLTVCRQLRRSPRTAGAAIVMLTTDEVVQSPSLSYATAVSAWEPSGASLQTIL